MEREGDVQSAMTMAWEPTTWRHWAEELMLVNPLMMEVVGGLMLGRGSVRLAMRSDAMRCLKSAVIVSGAARHCAGTLKAQGVQIGMG